MLHNGIVYWPESGAAGSINYVGYNHAVGILKKSVGDIASSADYSNARCRLYCNIPWHHNPKQLKVKKLPIIAYTMFESTKLPNAWRNFLNQHVAACVVPTMYCKEVFRMSGVIIPIKVSCLGVDKDEFSYIKIKPHKEYNFLWQGHNYDPQGRKAGGAVEQAFIELRKENRIPKSATLIMKYRPHNMFHKIKYDMLPVGNNIFHLSDTLSSEKINELYSIVDCCVNSTHGEGWGFIPLEQMVIGRPVILTGYSFPFLNEEYNIPVDYDLGLSPVTWCHKHISFGKWGFDYNLGGMIHEHLTPMRLPKVANGCMEYGLNNEATRSTKTIKKALWNAVASLQHKTGMYWKPSQKRHTILFEHQGYDAHINIEDLKNKMETCLKNKKKYQDFGKRASEWALNTWNLERVKSEFKKSLTELISEGVI